MGKVIEFGYYPDFATFMREYRLDAKVFYSTASGQFGVLAVVRNEMAVVCSDPNQTNVPGSFSTDFPGAVGLAGLTWSFL